MNHTNVSRLVAYSGLIILKNKDLQKYKAAGQKVAINITGILIITKDVTPELALNTIDSIQVHGKFKASPEIKHLFVKAHN